MQLKTIAAKVLSIVYQRRSSEMNSVFLQLLFMVATFNCAEPYLIKNSFPIIWRQSDKDIIEGFADVQLTYALLSPCSSHFLTPEVVHKDNLETARKYCEQKYKTYYLDEMQKLCPPISSHLLQKREVTLAAGVALGVGAAVISVVGVVAAGLAVWNRVDIELTLKKRLNEQLDMIKANREIISELQRKFSNMLDDMQKHQKDFDELKSKSIHTSYAVATLVNFIATQNTLIREATRQWKQNIVSHSILDIFNITLPCSPNCTLKNAKPNGCFTAGDNLSMKFYLPMLNNDLVLLYPDPFKLLVKSGNKSCSAVFEGIKNLLLSKSEKCVYGTNVAESYERNMLAFPGKKCIPFKNLQQQTQTSNYYVIDKCQDEHESEEEFHQSLVQTKLEGHNIHIYCPGSFIKIGETDMECPNYVFVLPINTNFSLNGVTYTVKTWDIVKNTSVVPAFSYIANTFLGKTIDWTKYKVDVATAITTKPLPGMFDWVHDILQSVMGFVKTITIIGAMGAASVIFVKFILPCMIHCRRPTSRGGGFPGVVNFNVGTGQAQAVPSFFPSAPPMPSFNINKSFDSSNFFKKW